MNRRIKQLIQKPNQCGQTVVAMLLNLPPSQICREMNRDGVTYTRDLVKCLRAHGIPCGGRLVRIKDKSELPANCIVKVSYYDFNRRRRKTGHWVLQYRRRMYDPEDQLEDLEIDLELGDAKITSYLPLETGGKRLDFFPPLV